MRKLNIMDKFLILVIIVGILFLGFCIFKMITLGCPIFLIIIFLSPYLIFGMAWVLAHIETYISKTIDKINKKGK